jgi:hypothetical protein
MFILSTFQTKLKNDPPESDRQEWPRVNPHGVDHHFYWFLESSIPVKTSGPDGKQQAYKLRVLTFLDGLGIFHCFVYGTFSNNVYDG